MSNDLVITDTTSGLTCSFAGGCLFEITAGGLSTLLQGDSKNNMITVCDSTCEYQDDLSTASKAICKVPSVSTSYSNENFKILKESEDLNTGELFGSNADFSNAFDNDLLNNSGDKSANCHIGVKFKENHVGLISQVRYFFGDI